jgi:hypothetical protein
MRQESPVYELHVHPTYAVYIPQRSGGGRPKTSIQIQNEENLKDNTRKPTLSQKAVRRLTNSVNWLVASSKKKWIYDKRLDKRFGFKVNFITLTLPTLHHDISDHHFKSVLLHNFINSCRNKYDMKNFVWKVEAQENGNIHAHFTTDTFIHWKDIRTMWNTILRKNGVIEKYQSKHQNLTFHDYCNYYNIDNSKTPESLKKAYDYGVSTNWSDPNTTDVHAVWKVKDIAAYLAKYMGKKEEDRREIKGRLWSCSYNLSEKNKIVIEIQGNTDYDYIHELCKPEIKYKTIETMTFAGRQSYRVGEIFFYKLSHWGTVLKGRLLEAYNLHRFNIRYNIDVQSKKIIYSDDVEQPEHYIFEINRNADNNFSQPEFSL